MCLDTHPLQEPLRPAAQAIDADSHLGEGSNVQDLHDEGVILFPLEPGDQDQEHKEGKLGMSRARCRVRRDDEAFTQP